MTHSSGPWVHPPSKRTPFPKGKVAVWLALVAVFLTILAALFS